MKKILILSLLMTLLIASNSRAEECEIPGKTIHWITDYCLYQAETDDFLNEKVQNCIDQNQAYEMKNTCENKKKYKMKICAHLARNGHFNGNAELCFNDMEFVPSTVKNDGV